MTPRPAHRPLLVALAALALAGCSASSAGEVRDQGAARSGPPLSVPQATTATADVTIDEPVGREPGQPDVATLYLVRLGRLEAVGRPLGDGPRQRAGLTALLDGPTAAERSLEYRSAVPRGTELIAFSVDGATATVDLSTEFATSDGTVGFDEDRVLALAQVVYTVTDIDGVDSVRLLVDGEPAATALGGALVDRLDREFVSILLAQTLDLTTETTCFPTTDTDESAPQTEPVVLGRLRMRGNRLIVRGRLASGEPRTLVTRVLHDGNELLHEIATGCAGTFRQELAIPGGVTGELVIETYVPLRTGARDGLVRKRLVLEDAG